MEDDLEEDLEHIAEVITDTLRSWEPCTSMFLKGVLYDEFSWHLDEDIDDVFEDVTNVLRKSRMIKQDDDGTWTLTDKYWEENT